ncbi:MAG: hypothetical protein C0183_15190 [Roseiflexus castenholzii]|nr:MAG: hypothetical protein C0183_15190 [Roseiflexus castenholzii]
MLSRIKALIEEFPTCGCRRICVLLRTRDKPVINRTKVHRLMREQRWLITQRSTGPKPRAEKSRSHTERSNERWAMDITHVSYRRLGVCPARTGTGSGTGAGDGLSGALWYAATDRRHISSA